MQKNEIVAEMSHKMGIPQEKLLKAMHKNEAHKQAEKDIEEAMKYLKPEKAEDEEAGADDEDSSIVPDKMDPEEVQRIAKERKEQLAAAGGDAAESTNPKGGTEIKGGLLPGMAGHQSEVAIDLGSIGGGSNLPRL